MSYRRLLVVALLAGMPAVASAQFTTFIPPQNKIADSVKQVVAAAQKARTDSTTQAQITDMKTWVDSAAGLAPAPTTAAETLAAHGEVVDTAATVTRVNGVRAPETASELPLLLLMGAALLVGGLILHAGTEPPAPARARSRPRSRA